MDEEGMELPDLAAAHEESVKWMAELLTELSDDFWNDGRLVVLVTDDRFRLLFSVTTMAAELPGAEEVINRSRQRLNASDA